jgi:hypothetical protein
MLDKIAVALLFVPFEADRREKFEIRIFLRHSPPLFRINEIMVSSPVSAGHSREDMYIRLYFICQLLGDDFAVRLSPCE